MRCFHGIDGIATTEKKKLNGKNTLALRSHVKI